MVSANVLRNTTKSVLRSGSLEQYMLGVSEESLGTVSRLAISKHHRKFSELG
jgi:hypothetical protein